GTGTEVPLGPTSVLAIAELQHREARGVVCWPRPLPRNPTVSDFPQPASGTRAPVAGRPVARPRTVASARYVSPELDEARRSVTDVSTWGSVAPARRAAASASSRAMTFAAAI